MVIKIKEYSSAREIAETLDNDIAESKSALGEYLRRLDDIRKLAEKSKKVREVVMKLAGKKNQNENPGEVTVGNLNIVLDANPFHELITLETAVRSHQDHLITLQKVRESLKWLDQLGDAEGMKYLVLENEGVPERILFKTA